MQPPPIPKQSNIRSLHAAPRKDDDNRPVLIAIIIFLILVLLFLLILLLLFFGNSGGGSSGNQAHSRGQNGDKTGGFDKDSVGYGAGKAEGNEKDTSENKNSGSSQKSSNRKTSGSAKREDAEAAQAAMAKQRLDKKRRERQLKSRDQSSIATLGAKGGATFFGTAAVGDNFVYVIDISGSMGDYNRKQIAMRELEKSVQALPTKSYFGVVFYHQRKVIHAPIEYCQATTENKEKLSKYLPTVKLGGSTRPTSAVLHALKLKPDAVFLLSDGEFSQTIVNRITDGNNGEIPIHTVAMGGERRTLSELARRNDGYYTVVRN